MASDEAPKLNFASAAARATSDTVLKVVQIDGQVLLKIRKHCQESYPTLVTGQLLGLDVGQTLEVTDCFPFPSIDDDREAEDEGASYQIDMMKCLREVNVDNNTVGWYQSTIVGSFQTVELIETFINYWESIKRCVCIVYDPHRTTKGGIWLKAIKLTDAFIKQYQDHALTAEKLRTAKVSWNDVFQEIPIKVQNSSLATALMSEIEPDVPATKADFDRLQLAIAPFLEKNLQFLNECVDDIVLEQTKVSMYHKNVARQAQQQAQWLQKRKQDNAQRRAQGEEPLPEEDLSLFKPIPEPTQLVSYLLNNQIANYCEQIDTFTFQTLQKLELVEALQDV